jgi:3-phosphoshikimate 1-carboxyvinyltransferase
VTAYPEKLAIVPFTRPVRGPVTIPGSKSITNRALMLATLCPQPTLLTGALFSDDTRFMAEALRTIGFTITADESAGTLRVSGQTTAFNNASAADLFVGLAGTAARFLTALCAAAPRGLYRIDGVPQMRKRPMQPLIAALRELGADIRCTGEEGFFPIEIHARGLRGGNVTLDATESSQLLSALLMVAPLAATPVHIHLTHHVRWPFVQMTINQMAAFGYALPAFAQALKIIPVPRGHYGGPAAAEFAIEPDATAASYFLTLPYVAGGSVRLGDLAAPGDGLQGDTAYLNVLARVGGTIAPDTGDVAVTVERGVRLASITQDFSEFSDTFLTLAAIAPLLDGPTRITGIAHTRKQETDRVAGVARELIKLGQDVVEEHDALTITPRPLKSGVEIETYGDHRFAMSFGILGCHDLHGDGRPWLTIKDPACCAKTFPHFFELLESLRKNSLGK